MNDLGAVALREFALTSLVTTDELRGEVHKQFAVGFGDFAEKPSQAMQVARGITFCTPLVVARRLSHGNRWRSWRLVPFIKKDVKRDFQSAGEFFKRIDGWDGVSVLDAGNVAALQ